MNNHTLKRTRNQPVKNATRSSQVQEVSEIQRESPLTPVRGQDADGGKSEDLQSSERAVTKFDDLGITRLTNTRRPSSSHTSPPSSASALAQETKRRSSGGRPNVARLSLSSFKTPDPLQIEAAQKHSVDEKRVDDDAIPNLGDAEDPFDFKLNTKPYLSTFTRHLALRKAYGWESSESENDREYFKNKGVMCNFQPRTDKCREEKYVQTEDGQCTFTSMWTLKHVLLCIILTVLIMGVTYKYAGDIFEICTCWNSTLEVPSFDEIEKIFNEKFQAVYDFTSWQMSWVVNIQLNLTLLSYLASLIIGAAALCTVGYTYSAYLHSCRVQRTVGRVVTVLINHERNLRPGGDPFIPISHVRDLILPLEDRQRFKDVWRDSVDLIRNMENRGRVDFDGGAERLKWRWVSPSRAIKAESINATI